MWGGIVAGLKVVASLLGLGKWLQRRQERREDRQQGAKVQRLEDAEAENKELRKDAKVYTQPSDPGDADARARRLARRVRKRTPR